LDPNGRPIVGLSYNKKNRSFYATYSNPRVYFGSDIGEALFKFRQYENQQRQEEPVVEIPIPDLPGPKRTGEVKWSEISSEPPVIPAVYAGETAILPENLFLEEARKIILTDPIEAAKKLGIPELSRLTDLPSLEPPLSLEAILRFYLDRRKPSKEERKKAISVWKEFCKIVKVSTVREITDDIIHDYCDAIWATYEEKGWSTSWLKGKFSRVKTIFNYSRKQGRTNKAELRRVLEYCSCLGAPTSVGEDAQPIEREHVHKLLSYCKTKWRAIILLALNCGYYAKDIHDLKKAMVRNKNGFDYIVFPREKNKHKRINVLWAETKQALDEYLVKKKFNTEYVFTSQFGTPFDPHDVQRCFDRLRKKVGVPDEVKFAHFRDGAASALFGKVEADMLKVTIGHRIKGEKSKYITVKPEQVKVCADIIHQEYFG
jgi:integrase